MCSCGLSIAGGNASAGSASEARCAASAIAGIREAGAGCPPRRAGAAVRPDFCAVVATLLSFAAGAAVFFAALVVFLAAGVRAVFLATGADGSDAFA